MARKGPRSTICGGGNSMRAALLYVASVLAFVTGWTATGVADETLVLATQVAPTSPQNTEVHHPWANRVNEAGKGVVRIEVRDGPTIVNASNSFPRVMDDVVQMSTVSLSYFAGRFPLGE